MSVVATESPTESPSFELGVKGSITLSGADAGSLTPSAESQFAGQIEESFCPDSPDVSDCNAEVTFSNASRRRLSRQLQSSELIVEFTLWIQTLCDAGCSDASTVSTAIYDKVTGDLLGGVQDGSFLTRLSAASADLANVLASATASVDFCPIIVPVLGLLGDQPDWYPDWAGHSGTCKNDGEYP